jgi:TRAP-type mannitol/chloroaromatic compound transport system permease small subunit
MTILEQIVIFASLCVLIFAGVGLIIKDIKAMFRALRGRK